MKRLPGFILVFILFHFISCQKKEKEIQAQMDFKIDVSVIEKEDKKAKVYHLKNGNGMEVEVLSYGAILSRIVVPDREGNLENILLTYESPAGFFTDRYFFGAIAGRYANRIAKGRFELDGVEYRLATNNGENHLHGGVEGFNRKFWESEVLELDDAIGVKMSYLSEDGEEGYPGNLSTTISFVLHADNSLSITMEAETDQSTVVNLTHHGYFNLSGMKESILGHEIQIFAENYTPVRAGSIPTGELAPVEGTPFDFRKGMSVGSRIAATGGGYDHNYVIKKAHDGELSKMAVLSHAATGRRMLLYSDKPGVQFYTGNSLDGRQVTHGVAYGKNFGLCLEPQFFPDSPNQPQFPSARLDPGDTYRHRIIYAFEVF